MKQRIQRTQIHLFSYLSLLNMDFIHERTATLFFSSIEGLRKVHTYLHDIMSEGPITSPGICYTATNKALQTIDVEEESKAIESYICIKPN